MDTRNIDELLNEQLDLLEKSYKLTINFGKKGARQRKIKGIQYYLDQINALNKFNKEFQDNNKILTTKILSDHEYFTIEVPKRFNAQYDDGITFMNEKLREEIPESQIPNTTSVDDSTASSPFGTRLQQIQQTFTTEFDIEEEIQNYTPRPLLTRLPPIEIPKFKGDEKEWPPFIEIFNSLIHENTRLSNVEKLRYLLSFLEGNPRKLIEHFTITSANYESALKLLKGRYENKRIMLASYLRSISQYKKLTPGSAYDIINFHDLLNASLAGIENLGYDVSSWNPMLVSIVTDKFDNETNKAFEEYLQNPTEMPSLEMVQKFLLQRYRILKAM